MDLIMSVERFWINQFFNCDQAECFSNKNIIVKHYFLKGYNGFFVLNNKNRFIISAPDRYVNILTKQNSLQVDYFEENIWRELLKDDFNSIIGPAWIGYCAETQLINLCSRELNIDYIEDRNSLKRFREGCDAADWKNSSIDEDSVVIFAQFIEDQIVAVASYKIWGDNIAHVGIITHPLYRRKGYAKNVLMALTNYGLERSMIMQYRTLTSNIAAIKVAEACGFHFFASHISVRLNK